MAPTLLPYDDRRHRDAVIALWRRVFAYPEPHNEPGLVIDRKLACYDLFFVAEDDGALVGTVMAGYDGHRGWIYSLAVDESRRGQGIGRVLLRHAEERLERMGCLKINLQVVEGNTGAEAFYVANGYRREPCVHMTRILYTGPEPADAAPR